MRPAPDVDHVCPRCGDAWPLTPDYWPWQTTSGHWRAPGHLGSPCRACAAEKALAWRRARGARPLAVWLASRQRRHGLRATYTHGCRCAPCREAERVYRAGLRRRSSGAVAP